MRCTIFKDALLNRCLLVWCWFIGYHFGEIRVTLTITVWTTEGENGCHAHILCAQTMGVGAHLTVILFRVRWVNLGCGRCIARCVSLVWNTRDNVAMLQWRRRCVLVVGWLVRPYWINTMHGTKRRALFRLGYSQLPKQKVKVIDIGPDPPHLFKKYIWGRTCEYLLPLSCFVFRFVCFLLLSSVPFQPVVTRYCQYCNMI